MDELSAEVEELRAQLDGGGDDAVHRLAHALSGLAQAQHSAQLWDESLTSATEAVTLLRKLSRRHRDAEPTLVSALMVQFTVLMTLTSRRSTAARVVAEAGRRARRLAKRDFSYAPLLAETLLMQALAADLRHEAQTAVRSSRKALVVTRRLTARDAQEYAPLLVRVLSVLAQSLQTAGGLHSGEAEEHAQAAAAAVRMLVETGHEDARALLVTTLTQTAATLRDAGRLDAAAATAAELVMTARELEAEDAPYAEDQLINGLSVQAGIVRRLGGREEAAAIQRELVRRMGSRLAQDPGEWAELAVAGTQQLQQDLTALGVEAEAARAELGELIDPQLVSLALHRAS